MGDEPSRMIEERPVDHNRQVGEMERIAELYAVRGVEHVAEKLRGEIVGVANLAHEIKGAMGAMATSMEVASSQSIAARAQMFEMIKANSARIAVLEDRASAHINEEHKDLALALQRLGDDARSREITVVEKAKALKEADEARRDQAETHWTPFKQTFAVIAALATVIGILNYLASNGGTP